VSFDCWINLVSITVWIYRKAELKCIELI